MKHATAKVGLIRVIVCIVIVIILFVAIYGANTNALSRLKPPVLEVYWNVDGDLVFERSKPLSEARGLAVRYYYGRTRAKRTSHTLWGVNFGVGGHSNFTHIVYGNSVYPAFQDAPETNATPPLLKAGDVVVFTIILLKDHWFSVGSVDEYWLITIPEKEKRSKGVRGRYW